MTSKIKVQKRRQKLESSIDQTAYFMMKRYRAECKLQQLGPECALATMAMEVIRFGTSMEHGPFHSTIRHAYNMIRELENVIGALQKEFPEFSEEYREQQAAKATHSKTSPPIPSTPPNGQKDSAAPVFVRTNGDRPFQETS